MKQRLLIILPLLCLILSMVTPFVPIPVVSALSAIQQQGANDCNNASVSDANKAPYCYTGYAAGYNNQSAPAGCATSGGGTDDGNYPGLSACQIGYKLGLAAKPSSAPITAPTPAPSNVPSDVKSAAGTYCQGRLYSGTVENNCIAGYESGYLGNSKPAVCGSACVDGYTYAVTQLTSNLPSQCQGWTTGSNSLADEAGCQIGVTAQLNGQSNPCGSLSDTNKEQTACQGGFANTTAPAPTNAGSGSPQLTCDTTFTNIAITWILCPVIDVLTGIINSVDGLITDQLDIKTDAIFCNATTCQAYYTAWQSFRDIALGLMVIAGLVMVTSQAMGMELLDAYTIRKILPRILIAAVGITLSWSLMKFLLQASDDLGFGIRHIIYAPFSNLGETVNLQILGGNGVSAFFGSVAGGIGATALWLVAGGIGVLISMVGTAALAVMVAVLVLTLRQILIIMLILLAPVAIVAYILPNTHRFYKLWWESFSKALLMFPLIAAFIATGRVFSAVSFKQGTTISEFIGVITYFAPYFMIPLTFKFAGGAMNGLGGFVTSRTQGGFGAISGYRGGQRKSRLERVRGRGLYRKNTGVTGALNKLGHYTFNADEQLPYDLGAGRGIARGKYNPIGKAGNKLFGRQAAEMAGQKAQSFAEQTAKGVEQADMHYSTAWAALGLRNRFKNDFTQEGLAAMDKKYGINHAKEDIKDDDGNIVFRKGEATAWKAPDNGDYHGLLAYGEDLRTYGQAGTMAQYAGSQLDEGRVGTLTSFGKHMETQRASLQSVALSSAAKDGKLEPDEAFAATRAMRKSSDPATKAFAGAQLSQIERATQANRQDMRAGKGIRYDENSEPYYVHSDQIVNELQRDGTILPIEAHKTRLAYDSSNSMKGQAALGAKAESIRRQKKTLLSMAAGERPEILHEGEQQVMRDAIISGSLNTYTDPDSQLAWKEIKAELDKISPSTPEEEERARELVERSERERRGAGGGGPQNPSLGGPSGLPGGSGLPGPTGVG